MFAAILRRWRLVTPLALAVLAIAVVAGGLVVPASAHSIKFHFFGRAFALADDSTVIPDTACDTGFIRIAGSSSLDTGHCFGVDGAGEPGALISGSGNLEGIFADSTVVSIHNSTNTKGSVIAKTDLEEAAGAHFRNNQGCALANIPAFFPLTNTFTSGVVTTTTGPSGSGPSGSGPSGSGPSTTTSVTAVNNINNPTGVCAVTDTLQNPQGAITTGPTVTSTNSESGTTSTSNAFVAVPLHPSFTLLDDSFGVQQIGDAVFWADLIQATAVAECHVRSNGTTHAGVTSAIQMSDAAVREDNRLRYIGPQGSVGQAGVANTTFTISGFTFGRLIIRDILVTINEQHVFQDSDVAGIKVAAVHLVGTDADGLVKFNYVLGAAFAGIHCNRHLSGTDTLIIPGT